MAIINVNSTSTWFQRFKGSAATGDGSGVDAGNPLTHLTYIEEIGETSDAIATTATGNLSTISLLKGVLSQLLSTFARPQTATATNIAFSSATTSFTLLTASTTQKKRVVVNNLDVNLLILFGTGTASASNYSEVLAPLGSLEFGPGDYFGQLTAIAPGATSGSVAVTFWA